MIPRSLPCGKARGNACFSPQNSGARGGVTETLLPRSSERTGLRVSGLKLRGLTGVPEMLHHPSSRLEKEEGFLGLPAPFLIFPLPSSLRNSSISRAKR